MLLSSPVTEDPLWGLWPCFRNGIGLVHFWHSEDPFEAFSFCLGLLLWKCTVFPFWRIHSNTTSSPTAKVYSNKLTFLCCIYCTIYSEDLHCVAIHLQNFRMFLNQGWGLKFGIKRQFLQFNTQAFSSSAGFSLLYLQVCFCYLLAVSLCLYGFSCACVCVCVCVCVSCNVLRGFVSALNPDAITEYLL